MIRKILIVNRGEIAVRIIRACRELEIKSCAVYSEADKNSLHIKLADEAVHIGAASAAESYLNQKLLIERAIKVNADAIHPGYGFLSENNKFIKLVEDAGLIFIGPTSSAVALMGSKTAARTLMQKHNVPIVPGTTKPIESLDEGLRKAEEISYPVLLKAAAGGGGKGMRRINSHKEFQTAFEATRREALKAFSNDEVYLEKFIEQPKHIEVQVIADKHGNYVHLFERECSIQRRHQKIIEESPSSFVDESTREQITKAAVNAAKACNYVNAGTIEFLMSKDKSFYFLEMNTRIQVEHPVTEMITGIDLVKEQISVAAGDKLSFTQADISKRGYAIECRIYAEDSLNDFLPSTGVISHYKVPSGPGVRVDSGFEKGSEITIYYDPMIAKLICWDKDRENALKRMIRALNEYQITGVTTNISFLKGIIENKDFISGNYDINFLDILLKDNSFLDQINRIEPDLLTAASIFASLKKQEKSLTPIDEKVNSSNKWRNKIFE